MDTKEKLDKITELQAAQHLHDIVKERIIEAVIPQEIKDKIAEIKAEFEKKDLTPEITRLTDEVKNDVLAAGHTIKGTFLMAVYNKGRVSWDSKALDGYLISHPELAQYRKEGAPSVSIRGT